MIANTGQDLEELEFELIDAGAEEVFEDEGGIMIYGDFPNFGGLQKALEENEFEILSSGFDRIPTTLKKLSEEQEADVHKLLEKIEDDDDVQNVYHNMQE
jgi:transcriptional/translational regulatory protein YebC/TACO1